MSFIDDPMRFLKESARNPKVDFQLVKSMLLEQYQKMFCMSFIDDPMRFLDESARNPKLIFSLLKVCYLNNFAKKILRFKLKSKNFRTTL
jgi:hypothetical protein